MDDKFCSQCSEKIDSNRYIISEDGPTPTYIHIECFFPSMVKIFKDITRDFIKSVEDKYEEDLAYSDLESLLDEIQYEDEIEDLDEVDEFDDFFDFEDEINKEFPSAA